MSESPLTRVATDPGGGIAAYADSYNPADLVEVKNAFVNSNIANEGDGGGIFVKTIAGVQGIVKLLGGTVDSNIVYGKRNQANQVISGGHGGAIASFNSVVSTNAASFVRHNREGVLSAPTGGMYNDGASNPSIAAGTFEDNLELPHG